MQADNASLKELDLAEVDILSLLEAFDEGVLIAGGTGRILFYNDKLARMDDLDPLFVIGKRVTDIYNLDDDTSMVMRCIRTGKPIIGQLFFYRTLRGRIVNTIHSVYPLHRNGDVIGAVCFVKDYKMLERTIAAARPAPPQKERLGNGTRYRFADIVGDDEAFAGVVRMARLSADSPSPVMLCGETGTGKELFAQSIHNHGPRRRKPFVGINCAAIPENLLEGLLFGTTRGAFTGSVDKEGIFEQASGGTLFLDEVNSMPGNLQAKLLRALQEKKTRRIGGSREIDIDIKIISSVNTDPHQAIKNGTLRIDLFYRLGVVFLRIPPLRERLDGIEALIRHFIEKNNRTLGKNVRGVSDEVMDFFKAYEWPGNVRELEHIIEGTMNMIDGDAVIRLEHLPIHFIHPDFRRVSLCVSRPRFADSAGSSRRDDLPADRGRLLSPSVRVGQIPIRKNLQQSQHDRERSLVRSALADAGGNVSQAARLLGISRQLLHYKIKKYGIERKHYVP